MNGKEEYRFRTARETMVADLVSRGVLCNPSVIQAFLKVPRHLFLDEALRDRAYQDQPLPIGNGQTISHPSTVAGMTELLDIRPGSRILEIGTGTGYQAAILAELAGKVFSIETIVNLARKARKILEHLGYYSIRMKTGDGSRGWPDSAPFDRIVVSAGTQVIPPKLIGQLTDGGRMVVPIGSRDTQVITSVIRDGSNLTIQEHDRCRFVDLVGKYGWPADPGHSGGRNGD
ncbi:protein-L-isoaspartate(D-aspartate) O-methyltransferase [bacterium]|nr:protein-L-isoaspartate(D-aspartate) O-methyltransferase [candidate division CSSED10-310 bacterium]